MASYDALINLKVRGLKDLSKIDSAVNGITKGAKDTTEAVKNGNKALMTQGLRLRALAKGQNTLVEKFYRVTGKRKGGAMSSFLLPDSKALNASKRGIQQLVTFQDKATAAAKRAQDRRIEGEKRIKLENQAVARSKAAADRAEIKRLQQIINLRTLAAQAGRVGSKLGDVLAPPELKTRGKGGKMLALPSAEMRAGLPGAYQNAPGFRGTRTRGRGSSALQSALISGAFPMLFGQGPLGGAAGFAGGYLGTKMGGQMGGFAGGLVATAALQSIQNAVSAITKLGQALNPFTADIGKLSQALGIAGTAEGARLRAIEALSGKQAALTEATRLMNQQLGAAATQTLKIFGEKMQGVSNEFAKVMTRLGAAFADLITETGILDFLEGVLKFINGIDVQKLKGFTQVMMAMSGRIDPVQMFKGIKNMTSKSKPKLDQDPTIGITTVGSRADMFLGNEKEKRMDELNILKATIEGGKELGRIEEIRVGLKNKLKSFGLDINDLDQKSVDIAVKGLSDQDKLIDSYKKQLELVKQIKDTIAGGLTNAIMGLIDGTKTLAESLAGILKQIGQILIQKAIMSAIDKIPFGGGGATTGSVSDLTPVAVAAEGAYWKNGIKGFSSGGLVTRPTIGLIGEAGEDEYIIPASKMSGAMDRYSAGARGQAVIPGGGTVASGSGVSSTPTVVNYTGPVLSFNSEAYVPKSAIPEIINSAARRGAQEGQSKVFSQLKNSRSQRSRVGL